jgi:sensor histidine kinase YesM
VIERKGKKMKKKKEKKMMTMTIGRKKERQKLGPPLREIKGTGLANITATLKKHRLTVSL